MFKRGDLGEYIGIRNIGDNLKDFPSHYTCLKLDLEGYGRTAPLGRKKSPYDIFINLDGSVEMAVRSKKPKAVPLINCLSKKDIEKKKNTWRTSTGHRRKR